MGSLILQLVRWLDRRTSRLDRFINLKTLVALAVVSAAVAGLFRILPPTGVPTFDTIPDGSYTPAEAFELLGTYSPSQRTAYAIRELTLDVVFPAVYTLLFFVALSFSLRRAIGDGELIHGVRHVVWLAAPLDLAENLFAAALALSFDAAAGPNSTWGWLASAASLASTWKWRAVTACVLLLAGALIALLINGGLSRRGGKPRTVVETFGRGLDLVQYLYFQRLPLTFLLLLWGLGIGALAGNAELAGGLETRSLVFIFFTASIALFLSWLIASTFFLIWRQGPARFGVRAVWHPFDGAAPRLRIVPAAIVGSLPLAAIYVSRHPQLSAGTAAAGIGAAVVVVLGTLTFLDDLLSLLRRPLAKPLGRLVTATPLVSIATAVRALARWFGPGYWDEGKDGGQIAAGQVRAVIAFISLATLYWTVYLVWATQPPVDDEPAGAFVFILLALALSGLAGAAFALDRFRIPVLSACLALFVVLYGFNGVDHYFDVEYLTPATSDTKPVRIGDAVAARLQATAPSRAPEARPILIVTTVNGGGIQAAAWASHAMTGLEQEVAADRVLSGRGVRFLESVHLISSVSGGSVGALNLLAAMQLHGPTGEWSAPELRRVRDASQRSSLAALGWAMVYPEALRVLVPVYGDGKDRGWALEQAWRRALSLELGFDEPVDRANWAREVADGRLPGMVFNATIAETGAPIFITPLDTSSETSHVLSPLNTSSETSQRRDFGLDQLLVRETAAGGGFVNLDMVQAARLSANFPYAGPPTAPRCTSEPCPEFGAYHLVDGGYFDNYGVTAASDWLRKLRDADELDLSELFGAIAIVELRAFPAEIRRAPRRTRWTGAWAELIGPVMTMLRMRTTSQAIRNDVEIGSLCEILSGGPEAVPCERFIFEPGPGSLSPPLSWHLRPTDVTQINRAWQQIVDVAAAGGEGGALGRFLAHMRRHSGAPSQPAGS